jgi:hypothetical protein
MSQIEYASICTHAVDIYPLLLACPGNRQHSFRSRYSPTYEITAFIINISLPSSPLGY